MNEAVPFQRLAILLAVALTLPLLAACSTGKPRPAHIKSEYVQPDESGRTIYLTAPQEERRFVDSRSYTVGVRASAGVGETVAAVRRYAAGDRAVRAFAVQPIVQECGKARTTPDSRSRPRGAGNGAEATVEASPCTSGPLSYLTIAPGQMLRVAGGYEEDGRYYNLLAVDTPEGTLFLATDPYGYLKPDRYAAWRDLREEAIVTQLGIPLDVLPVDPPLRLEGPAVRYETEEVILPDSPEYVHFDLLYAGTSRDHRGTVWHLLYKEYRRNPAGTPIYTKRLDYVDDGSAVDLLGMRLQVHEATPSTLVYTVLRD